MTTIKLIKEMEMGVSEGKETMNHIVYYYKMKDKILDNLKYVR